MDLSMEAIRREVYERRPDLTPEGLSGDLARAQAEEHAILRYERAESEVDEDRILVELVDEGHGDALVRANIITEDEATNLYYSSPKRYEELNRAQRAILRAWIEDTFAAGEGEHWRDSYALKHDFERSRLGFYVCEGQFKAAMLEAGYEPSSIGDFPTFGWHFKIRRPADDTKWLDVELREELHIGPPTSDEENDCTCLVALKLLGEGSWSTGEWLEQAESADIGVYEFVPCVVRLAAAGWVERSEEGWKIREEADCE